MAKAKTDLDWCVVRFGEDMNWWVSEISDEVHWDVDGLGILDPRQLQHVIELCDPLREYGFDIDLVENAFFAFRIDKEVKGDVRLKRASSESILDSEVDLFALPDVVDEEKGPYAELLDQITRFRVKMLNDLIEFDESLTVDELEEEIRERQNADFFEGRGVHFFAEITAILEYVPEGFELDNEDDEDGKSDDDLVDIPDFEEEDEKIEEDETMKWDEDDEDEDEEDESEDGDLDEDEDR